MNRQNNSYIPTNPLRPQALRSIVHNNHGVNLKIGFAPLTTHGNNGRSTQNVRSYYNYHADRHYKTQENFSQGMQKGINQQVRSQEEADNYTDEIGYHGIDEDDLKTNNQPQDEATLKLISMVTRIKDMNGTAEEKDKMLQQVYQMDMFKQIIRNIPSILDGESGKPISNPAVLLNLIGGSAGSEAVQNSNQQGGINQQQNIQQIPQIPINQLMYNVPFHYEEVEPTPLKRPVMGGVDMFNNHNHYSLDEINGQSEYKKRHIPAVQENNKHVVRHVIDDGNHYNSVLNDQPSEFVEDIQPEKYKKNHSSKPKNNIDPTYIKNYQKLIALEKDVNQKGQRKGMSTNDKLYLENIMKEHKLQPKYNKGNKITENIKQGNAISELKKYYEEMGINQ